MSELEKIKCKHCGTVFYGVKERDTHCHICKTIILFREFFGLQDIEIDDIYFKRVRHSEFSAYCKADWRDFVPKGIMKMWSQLPFEAQVMAVMFAEREARRPFKWQGKEGGC